MNYPILTDDDGCARSIRSNCIQPVLGNIEQKNGHTAYTAIMDVYEVTDSDKDKERRRLVQQ